MFKRTEKKIKVGFRLQFAASQVPPLKKPALTVSLIPEDLGKPSVKLQKAPVKDGTCLWEHPVFETMKIVKILKTGVLKEKIYHFIVSAGSSKSGFLGEASIDFAEFAAETQPTTISLPLKFANSGAVLHVTIQRMQEPGNARDDILSNQLSNHDTDESNHYNAEEGRYQDGECDGSSRASPSTSYLNGSNEHISREEFEMGKNKVRPENYTPQNGVYDGIPRNDHGHQRSNTKWSTGSASDLVDSANSSEDSLPRETLRTASHASIEKLKEEISMLQRQVDISDLEIQSLRKQITKENKRGDNLMAQNTCLKEERDAIRIECKELRSSNNSSNKDAGAVSQLKHELDNTWILLDETREELTHEKEVSTNLKLQMEKTQELNDNLVLAVKDLEEILEQKNREISELAKDRSQQSFNTVQKENQEVNELQNRIEELCDEMEIYKKQREDMEMHMEKLTLDYEALKQEKCDVTLELEQFQRRKRRIETECNNYIVTVRELESEVQRLEEENRVRAQELSESLVDINELRRQVEELQKEMEEQAQGYKYDLDATTRVKLEQEQRAIRAEEALRMARYRNTKTSERHEEEFKRLSIEMASKVDENEKLATKAAAEAEELHTERKILEEALQKANEEIRLIRTQTEAEVQEHKNNIEQISFELNEKSTQLGISQKNVREKEETFLKETDILRAEIERITCEKETILSNLQSEVEQLHTQLNELNHSLSQEKAEKGNLSKRVVQLEDDLLRRQEEITDLEKRIGTMSNQAKKSEAIINTRDTKPQTNSGSAKELLNLKERLKVIEKQMAAKEAELQSTRSSFQEKEKIFISKIEKLESSMKKQEARHSENNAAKRAGSSLRTKTQTTQSERSLEKSLKEKEACNAELSTEMESLKKKNDTMVNELMELQERYSEITLKFAQVESERQELVMTVRNLKNGKN